MNNNTRYKTVPTEISLRDKNRKAIVLKALECMYDTDEIARNLYDNIKKSYGTYKIWSIRERQVWANAINNYEYAKNERATTIALRKYANNSLKEAKNRNRFYNTTFKTALVDKNPKGFEIYASNSVAKNIILNAVANYIKGFETHTGKRSRKKYVFERDIAEYALINATELNEFRNKISEQINTGKIALFTKNEICLWFRILNIYQAEPSEEKIHKAMKNKAWSFAKSFETRYD